MSLASYRTVMRCFKNTCLRSIGSPTSHKQTLHDIYTEEVPAFNAEQRISIANEYVQLQKSLTSLMDLHARYNIQRVKNIDHSKVAGKVGLRLPVTYGIQEGGKQIFK